MTTAPVGSRSSSCSARSPAGGRRAGRPGWLRRPRSRCSAPRSSPASCSSCAPPNARRCRSRTRSSSCSSRAASPAEFLVTVVRRGDGRVPAAPGALRVGPRLARPRSASARRSRRWCVFHVVADMMRGADSRWVVLVALGGRGHRRDPGRRPAARRAGPPLLPVDARALGGPRAHHERHADVGRVQGHRRPRGHGPLGPAALLDPAARRLVLVRAAGVDPADLRADDRRALGRPRARRARPRGPRRTGRGPLGQPRRGAAPVAPGPRVPPGRGAAPPPRAPLPRRPRGARPRDRAERGHGQGRRDPAPDRVPAAGRRPARVGHRVGRQPDPAGRRARSTS